MKKKIPMGRLEKLVILVMVVTLAVSILPQLDIQQLFAEDPATVTLELKEGSTTRPLSLIHISAFRKAVCLSYGRKKAFDCTGRLLVLYACFFIGVHISRIAEKQIKECKRLYASRHSIYRDPCFLL